MNARTRMLALSAAAKVTLVGAFGCEKPPMVTVETTAAPMSTPDAVAPLPTSDARAASPATFCGVEGTGVSTPSTLQCCQRAIAAVTAAGKKPAEPEEIACCAALVRANDDTMQGGSGFQEMPSREACCAVARWRGSMTCTPWGPPVPPEMFELDGVA